MSGFYDRSQGDGDIFDISLPQTTLAIRSKLPDREALIKILEILSPHIDLKKIIKTHKVESVLALCDNLSDEYPKVIPGMATRVAQGTKCQICGKNPTILHTCGNILCPTEVDANQKYCNYCNSELSSVFLYQLFGNTGKCKICNAKKCYTPCNHYCKRCLMHVSPSEFNCQVCVNSYEHLLNMKNQCFICSKMFLLIEDSMASLCAHHIACRKCAKLWIKRGCCNCGLNISITDIEFYFKNSYTHCEICQARTHKSKTLEKPCCGKRICQHCKNAACKNCISSAINVDY